MWQMMAEVLEVLVVEQGSPGEPKSCGRPYPWPL